MNASVRDVELRAPARADQLDAIAWALIALLVLISVPIGAISGDGLNQSAMYATGKWFWNPNHLLYEPFGAWWQATLVGMRVPRAVPDLLTLLSVSAGSAALGLVDGIILEPAEPLTRGALLPAPTLAEHVEHRADQARVVWRCLEQRPFHVVVRVAQHPIEERDDVGREPPRTQRRNRSLEHACVGDQ